MRNTLTLTFRSGKTFRFLAVLLALPICFMHTGKLYAQEKRPITGTVTEASTGQPLPGVTVVIKGTSSGAVTDIEGNYTINAAPSDVLVFNAVGYLTEEKTVGANTVIDVSLSEDIIGLDEVVVTGYGVTKKSDLTGAVASVSSEKLTEMPSVGVDQALEGRAAGVSIIPNTGMPGGDVQVQIRGISSSNGTPPLVIIDGVRSSLNNLNPGDIQSVEILKDASSAAIYGSSGGNGVILITTKKGKEGKIQANFNYYRGWEKPWKKIDMLNSQDYVKLRNYRDLEAGRTSVFSTRPDTFPNYDYQDIMFRTAALENYDFSVNGGSEKSTYFVSTNYSKEQGVLYKSDYSRLGFRINSDHILGKIIKVGENAQFNNVKYTGVDEWVYQSVYSSPIAAVLQMYPYIAPYDENGNWEPVPSGSNPVVDRDVLNRTRNNYSVGGNAYVDLTPIKGLDIKGVINAYVNNNTLDEFKPKYTYSGVQGNQWNSIYKQMEQQHGWQGQVYGTYNFTLARICNLGLMAGYERTIDQYFDMRGTRRDLVNETPEYRYFDGSTNDSIDEAAVHGGGWQDGQDAIFGRFNANLADQLLLTVNVRRDRSSRFGPDYRIGNFPSFSLGWKFSELEAVKNMSFLSFGKIRFGYGNAGANAPDRYAYYASINSTNQAYRYIFDAGLTSSPGAVLARYPNPQMHWETVKMSNLGVDLSFLQNSVSLTVDWFRKKSEGMLWVQPLPAIAGFYAWREDASLLGGTADPLVNVGSMFNQGIEVTLGYKKQFGDFKTNFDFNATYVRNKVTDVSGDSVYYGQADVNMLDLCLTTQGYPISQFNGYVTDGMFTEADARVDASGNIYIWNQPYHINNNGDTIFMQRAAQPGDFRYVDQNGDGLIDRKDRVNIGSPIPKFILGFSADIEYKMFDLNLFFEGKFGHKIFNGSKYALLGETEGKNVSEDILDQYRGPVDNPDNVPILPLNTNARLPRMNNAQNYSIASDFYIESGNYLRLKNLQIGFTLPEELTEKAGVEKFRVFVGWKNLLTLTKYTGFDPEIGVSSTFSNGINHPDIMAQGIDHMGNYPHPRSFIVGLNLQF
jgi:TonB-linked SusC/RagA family outer membrane protein